MTYYLTLGFRNSFTFSMWVTNALRLVQLTALPLFIILLILSEYNIYLRGYWAPKIIFWVWFLSAMLLFAFGIKKEFYKIEKIVYKILFFLPLMFFPLVLIPFIGGGIIVLFYASFIGDNSMILYASDNIRIEQSYVSFMGPPPTIDIYSKNNLFSYKDTTLDIQFSEKFDSIKVQELSSDSIKILYFKGRANGWAEPVEEHSIRLNKQ